MVDEECSPHCNLGNSSSTEGANSHPANSDTLVEGVNSYMNTNL